MQTLKLIIGLLVILLTATLVLANQWMLQQKFVISYLGYKTPEIHLILLLLASLTIGAIFAATSMLAGQLRLKSNLRQQRKKIRELEEELNSLRNLPLRESSEQLNNNREAEANLV